MISGIDHIVGGLWVLLRLIQERLLFPDARKDSRTSPAYFRAKIAFLLGFAAIRCASCVPDSRQWQLGPGCKAPTFGLWVPQLTDIYVTLCAA